MKKIRFISPGILLIIISTMTGCKKEENSSDAIGTSNGVFVVNEGSFGSSNGSITFFNPSTPQKIDDVFNVVNHRPLGDVVQSITIYKDKAYIVVNVSGTIEVVDKNLFASKGTITGIASPRFILPVNDNKAYVSDWASNNIKIVDLNSLSVTGSIPAGNGPEHMVLINNKVYVTNVGGFGIDSTITVIDATSDAVVSTIGVGLNPGSAVTDINERVWIMCNGWYGPDFIGGTADDVAGAFVKINPGNDSIEAVFNMGQFDHPLRLAINKDKTKLYYLMGVSGFDGSVYEFDISSSSLQASPLVNKSFYGLGIDPVTEDIYGGYSPVFGQSGYMFRYQNNGNLKDSVKVGIGPNGFAFNY